MGTYGHNLFVSLLLLALTAGLAFGAATWTSPTATLTTPAISAVGQVQTGTTTLSFTHDSTCTLTVSGSPVLTNGGSTLGTAYKLTGPGYVTNQDADWVDATTFLTHSYVITSTGPATTLTLDVRATPPNDRAPSSGVYSATLIMTLAW